MRFSTVIIAAALLSGLAFWLWNSSESTRDMIQSYVENGEFVTLEARYTPQQVMQANQEALIPSKDYSYREPSLRFYPYLLMEVKYTGPNKRTKEGVILWSMVDGEMVLDTETWDKTHGFQDAVKAKASREDFLILNALSKYRGALSKARLQKELNIDGETLEQMIRNAKNKHLIIQRGPDITLHFQNPRFDVGPHTRVTQWMVTKPYNHVQKVSKRYTRSEIERTAKAAFGHDFTVRDAREVFLPVYRIEVLNPDESVLTTYWNAINGQPVEESRYIAQ